MSRLIVANWKMNGSHNEIDQWVNDFVSSLENYQKKKDISSLAKMVICPPAIFLEYFINSVKSKNIKGPSIEFGGQNCHHKSKGAYTSSTSAAMLKEVGCNYVLLGHSERKFLYCEDEILVSKKISRALDDNLIPIICIGETSEDRKKGHHFQVIGELLLNSLPVDIAFREVVIAYEPIWSINSDLMPTKEEISDVVKYIRNIVIKHDGIEDNTKIIYGGSVNLGNVKDVMSVNGLGGLLIGRASLDGEQFFDIAASSSSKK